MDNIVISSNQVEVLVSERKDGSSVIKFIICNFERNGNQIILNRENAPNCIQSLVHKPLLGKIITRRDGKADFSSHCVSKKVKYVEGKIINAYEFGTDAFGCFTDVAIERLNINGVEDDYITANAELWGERYPKAKEIIERRIAQGRLASSWELNINDSEELEDGTIMVNDWSFIGHCMLGSRPTKHGDVEVEPAYQCSRAISVAEQEEELELDEELSEVLIAEFLENNMEDDGMEERIAELEKKLQERDNLIAELQGVSKDKEIEELKARVSELENTVSEKETVIAEKETKLAEKDNSIIEMGKSLEEKDVKIAELMPYKEEHDLAVAEAEKAERAKKVEALKSKALTMFSEEEIKADEEFEQAISELNEALVNSRIAEKYVSECKKKAEEENKKKEEEQEQAKKKCSEGEEEEKEEGKDEEEKEVEDSKKKCSNVEVSSLGEDYKYSADTSNPLVAKYLRK